MRLRVLGTAAGGGLPQWNCACPGCAGARAHPERRRRHASLAFESSPGRWYLVNATPDLGEQIEAHPELHPGPARRHTPVRGVVLTDAELDHTLGIPRLREGRATEIWATPTVRRALTDGLGLDRVLSPYTELRHLPIGSQPVPMDRAESGSVEISAVAVSGKRPRYARTLDLPERGWVTALCLHDRATGGSLVYAPAVAEWTPELDKAIAEADCVIVDGTFWDDDEPARNGLTPTSSTAMGHLPITGPEGTADRLTDAPGRCYYTHLNNTNPLNDPASEENRVLAQAGLHVALEGMEIEL
ncbi:pyrroloquinoline quinone biosynthesis protein B [Actinacidiphila yanglinensis]|uniref:Coenzyme PQQ synthesis protein B n=1 Tax=Actinacidiphila yanglinensis TaxID=310779 RepID=A0A1H6DC02_9ACTN|nr:pyrroloquinoline quinone biosynthesis protein PqqB [Actinacidiphila yanglinensis]SEG82704.1 pyrroloquinoline quinone biosynthesis protein B [Actinacidiphila yanglinensis]